MQERECSSPAQQQEALSEAQGHLHRSMHGDHVLGLPGLLSTMSLLGGKQLTFGVLGIGRVVASHVGQHSSAHVFEVNVRGGLNTKSKPCTKQAIISCEHPRPAPHSCCGLRVEEHSLPWKWNGQRPEGPASVSCPSGAQARRVHWLRGPRVETGVVVHAAEKGTELRVLCGHASL